MQQRESPRRERHHLALGLGGSHIQLARHLHHSNNQRHQCKDAEGRTAHGCADHAGDDAGGDDDGDGDYDGGDGDLEHPSGWSGLQ